MILAMDNVTSKQLETLAPHKNMFNLNSPRTLSKAASLPKPVVSTISNWLNYKDDYVEPNAEEYNFLLELSV